MTTNVYNMLFAILFSILFTTFMPETYKQVIERPVCLSSNLFLYQPPSSLSLSWIICLEWAGDGGGICAGVVGKWRGDGFSCYCWWMDVFYNMDDIDDNIDNYNIL